MVFVPFAHDFVGMLARVEMTRRWPCLPSLSHPFPFSLSSLSLCSGLSPPGGSLRNRSPSPSSLWLRPSLEPPPCFLP